MKRLPAQDLCMHCGLPGRSVLDGEGWVARLNSEAFLRHPECGHVLMYRSSNFPLVTGSTPQLVAR